MWLERKNGIYYVTERVYADGAAKGHKGEAGRKLRTRAFKDKKASEQLMARLERERARGEVGMVDVFKAHRARPLVEHMDEYCDSLAAEGKDEGYVRPARYRLKYLADRAGWKTLADVTPDSFVAFRTRELRETRKGDGRNGAGLSPRTANHYLATVNCFLNWCAKMNRTPGVMMSGRMVSPILAGVAKLSDRQQCRPRRALTEAEVARLLAAAIPSRRLVYRFALATGLRRQELADLVWGDVRLNAIKPYLQLRAEATKARRADRLPLVDSLASDLRATRPPDAKDCDRVFAEVPSIKVWRADLKAASIPYIDERGRRADFHGGTRKTLCVRLHRAGVPLVTAMALMRHVDSKLTLVDYVDDDQIGTESTTIPEIQAAQPPAPSGAANATATAV